MASVDNSWIFDSLLCFLNSPMWNTPLHNFIDEKSIVFEPNSKKDDENDTEYKRIHNEFKNLVDLMLGSYLEDYGITPEQFEVACNKTMQDKMTSEYTINSFEAIWAANDFDIFKRMMIHQNIELQIQALELLERKHGVKPKLFTMESEKQQRPETSRGFMPLSEKQVMVEVINKYEAEPDKDVKNKINIETEKMKLHKKLRKTAKSIALVQALRGKFSESEITSAGETDAEAGKEKERKKKNLKKTARSIALLSSISGKKKADSDPETSRESKEPKEKKTLKRTASSLALLSLLGGGRRESKSGTETENEEKKTKKSFKKTSKSLALLSKLSFRKKSVTSQVSEDDVNKRKEYLKEQRDKLVELKKNVRKVQLTANMTGENRPQSAAKMAEDIVEGGLSVDEETLAKRRALAEKLRTEVITSKIDEE